MSGWTLVSRITGFGRVAVIAAVLGPTYFGNTYQAISQLPALITYSLLMGSLFSSLLVPSLVRHVDAGDHQRVERLAGAFLGLITLAFVAVAALAIVGGPLLLRMFALGVEDPTVAAEQRRVGQLLLIMVVPQIALYGVASTAAAVMNGHGRFALASAAPALENLGLMATLAAYAVVFGTGSSLQSVGSGELLLLGLGSTAAVGLHAAAQWWGAWRLGIRLRPRAGWRDPEVRQILQRIVPSLGYASLTTLRWVIILVAANRVAGGVVAFQLALNLYFLPAVLGVNPIALALLPQLSRLYVVGALRQLQEELSRGIGLALFLIVPAAAGFVLFAEPLAGLLSFGEMATAQGALTMVAVGVAALAPALLTEPHSLIGLQAAYARQDARSPFYSTLLGTLVSLAGMVVAFLVPAGPAVPLVLGLAFSAGNLVRAWDLTRRVRRGLPPAGRATPAVLRALAASALVAGPAYAAAVFLDARTQGHLGHLAELVAAGAVGVAGYVMLQWAWRSPELGFLVAGLRTSTPSTSLDEGASS